MKPGTRRAKAAESIAQQPGRSLSVAANVRKFFRWSRRLLRYYQNGLEGFPKYDRLVLIISAAVAVNSSIVYGLAIEILSALPLILVGYTKACQRVIEYDKALETQLNPYLLNEIRRRKK